MFPVIDMHCDTVAMIKSCEVQGIRKRKGLDTIVEFFHVTDEEKEQGITLRRNNHHLDAERLKSAGYFCQCLGMCSSVKASAMAGVTPMEYLRMLCDEYDAQVAECSDILRSATTASEMEENFKAGYVSVIKTIEDSMALGTDLQNLEEMYKRGVRVAGLTWNYENDLAYGNRITKGVDLIIDEEHGLKPAGFEFIRAMEEMGMILDISHLSDAGTRDVFRSLKPSTPVIATHSNARAVCRAARNLPDEFLKQLAERGGVTGINFCHAFLNDRYIDGTEKLSLISDMCEHMKYIRDLVGIDVIGLGSDFDGITSKLEVNGCGEIQKIAEGMEKAGFTDDEIEKVFYKNVLRVFKEVLG